VNRTTVSFILVLLSISLGNACQGANNSLISNTNVANANSTAASANASTVASNTPSGVTPAAGTPSAAYVAAFNARNSKDIQQLKSLMSKDILEFFTVMQKAENKTLDEALRDICEKPQAKTAEVRNEKIEGNTATLEYKDEDGGWQTMDFVKEDGTWKLTIPKADIDQMKPSADKKKG
jgi:hypothetical protein